MFYWPRILVDNFIALGGIETTIKIMNTHVNNAGICKYGCNTLGLIATKERKLFG